jgi:hypothetical protein
VRHITIIDRKRSAVVGSRSFEGSAPPASTTVTLKTLPWDPTKTPKPETITGSDPTYEAVEYLKNLPRRRPYGLFQ